MRWVLKPAVPGAAQTIEAELGVTPLVAQTLAARGITTPRAARCFINPDLEVSWEDPLLIAGLEEVCEHLEAAIRQGRRILVFGDYDVDGITATALMVRVLRQLGNEPQVILPRREGEGYGLTEAALARIYQRAPEVVLTVDCGIAAAAEVAKLQQRGIEVLITDHHENSGALPLDTPLVDPRLERGGVGGDLAGVGVALKLVALLGRRFGRPALWQNYLDLAALGTIADRMPLLDENRALVAAGLIQLNTATQPGIAALLQRFTPNATQLSATALSFGVIPRLNAAGRVYDPLVALDLLIEDDPRRVEATAQRLELLNQERRDRERQLLGLALEQAEQLPADRRVTIVGGEMWHEGVRGIVASRLAQRYALPAIVFSLENGLAIGSGRSVGQLNLHTALTELQDMFLRFGGHAGAVGITIKSQDLPQFNKRLEAALASLPLALFEATGELDGHFAANAASQLLTIQAVEELEILEPFGRANPEPLYLVSGARVTKSRAVGAGQDHLAFKAACGLYELDAIWFNCPLLPDVLTSASACLYDLVVTPQLEEWHGRLNVKLHIQDAQLTGTCQTDTVQAASAAEHVKAHVENKVQAASAVGSKQQKGLAAREPVSWDDTAPDTPFLGTETGP
ncbi:MAG: single-stranded-DNA-specific exonuclease RecJ [Coriobacteriales bacterium]|jgi:single-stranded-DNA-specific exonuclease|nr:single-stranded-DNA-specific exonuclease RecJ [Coriobacteriales bacterium]